MRKVRKLIVEQAGMVLFFVAVALAAVCYAAGTKLSVGGHGWQNGVYVLTVVFTGMASFYIFVELLSDLISCAGRLDWTRALVSDLCRLRGCLYEKGEGVPTWLSEGVWTFVWDLDPDELVRIQSTTPVAENPIVPGRCSNVPNRQAEVRSGLLAYWGGHKSYQCLKVVSEVPVKYVFSRTELTPAQVAVLLG